MTILRTVLMIASILTVGLMAGLFFAFTVAVMPALRQTDDRTFVHTMQRINVAIVNPVFLAVFVGALPLLILAVVVHRGRPALPWLVGALVFYLGTFVSTRALNIPLNNALDAAGPPDGIADLAGTRHRFEAPWVRYNTQRTVANLVSFGCLVCAVTLT